MAAQRGRTTRAPGSSSSRAGEQLELEWAVPPATPATTDFVCWLWAAFPPREGTLNISRIARELDIAPTTIRRWIAKDQPKLRAQQVALLHRRAILRGRGTYLWPDLDPVTRRRSELIYQAAIRNDQLITLEPDRIAPQWHENGTLEPHEVHIVQFDRAHAYGVSATRHEKALAKVRRNGELLETRTVDNKYAAIALKHEILVRLDAHRCITPRNLVPTGHTETWRAAGGPTTIRRPLKVNLVQLAGLPTLDTITRAVADHPLVDVVRYTATDADQACEALTFPADVVIFTSRGYTPQTWRRGTKQPWPGAGEWYAGGRRPGAPGMSLDQLAGGLEQHGGLQTRTLVLDVEHAQIPATHLQQLLTSSTDLVLRTSTPSLDQHVEDLNLLLNHLHHNLERDVGTVEHHSPGLQGRVGSFMVGRSTRSSHDHTALSSDAGARHDDEGAP